jgi:hypothetical protein
MGHVSDLNVGVGANIVLSAIDNWSVAVEPTGTPRVPVPDIPVTVTWNEESQILGLGLAETRFGIQGMSYYSQSGAANLNFVPDQQYAAELYAFCDANAIFLSGNTLSTAECQAEADPVFTFDQTDFTGGFNLADYYTFVYSPNLTAAPVPEPSGLLLLGTLLGLSALAARSKRHA